MSGLRVGPIGDMYFTTAGAGTRAAEGKLQEVISPEDFAAAASTASALTQIETAWPSGVGVRIPTGTYTLEAGLTLDANRMNIQGAGRWASVLAYNLAAAGPAITVNNPAAGGYNQGRIADVSFSSSTSTAKTFLDLYNVANFEVSRVATNSSQWAGDSIGIRVRGRQLVHIHGCEIGCARPIVFSPNTTFPTLAVDHFLVEVCELVGQDAPNYAGGVYATRPVIEVESGVMFTNTTFRHLALAQGAHGIYWNDTAPPGTSYNLVVDEVRTEQGRDPAAYSFYFSTTGFLQSAYFKDSYLDSQRNGIYLFNAQNVILDGVTFSMGAGKAALNITLAAGGRLIIRNCYVQTGATITISNARCVSRQIDTSTNIHNEEWVYDDGTTAGLRQGAIESAAYHAGAQVVVGAGSTLDLVDNAFEGWIDVSYKSGHVGGIFYVQGTSGTTLLQWQSNAGWFGTAAGAANLNLYLSGGVYVLQNNTASSATLRVRRRGAIS